MDGKVCSACGVFLPFSVFTRDRRTVSGLGSRCKACKASKDFRRNGSGVPERGWVDADLNVLSLGAGVQSSTLLLMSCVGVLPKLDAAIFADTGWEPPEVYGWLYDVLVPAAGEAGIPVHVVSFGNIRDTAGSGFVPMPVFSSLGGKRALLRRLCTQQYKINPIRSLIFSLSGRGSLKVSQWLGISVDELGRMRDSDVLYMRNRYPLVDLGMSRQDCVDWLAVRGFGVAPRSACVGCPFHSDLEWLEMRSGSPEVFEDAVGFEREMRVVDPDLFLHSSLCCLDEVEFGVGGGGEECGGYCWV